MERKLIGVTLRGKNTAVWVRERTGASDILVDIKKKEWSWAGQVARRPDNRRSIRITE